jgi:L-malate glycosyltransferase
VIAMNRAISPAGRGGSEPSECQTILHVFSGDLWAGAEVVIFNLLSRLKEDGQLRVLALSLNEGVLAEKLRAVGVTTYVVPEARHSLANILRQAIRLLKDTPIDAIHTHRYKENLLGWLLAKRLGVGETITTVHGLPEAPTRRRTPISHLRSQLNYFLLRRGFSHTVAVSDEMKTVLTRRHGFREDRIRVIRNGAVFPPVEATRRNPRPGYFHIGTVARLVPVKGLDLFLEVAAAVRRRNRLVRFSVLGDGPLRADLARRANELRLGDCLDFAAPRPDPFPYYRTLDLYLNTSIHEGIPLSVIEAMACGMPVVSSAVGGIPEILRHGEDGFLVEGRDASSFAECCLRLMHDDRLREETGARAAARARSRFSASSMAQAYRQLYAEIRTARAASNARMHSRPLIAARPAGPAAAEPRARRD